MSSSAADSSSSDSLQLASNVRPPTARRRAAQNPRLSFAGVSNPDNRKTRTFTRSWRTRIYKSRGKTKHTTMHTFINLGEKQKTQTVVHIYKSWRNNNNFAHRHQLKFSMHGVCPRMLDTLWSLIVSWGIDDQDVNVTAPKMFDMFVQLGKCLWGRGLMVVKALWIM